LQLNEVIMALQDNSQANRAAGYRVGVDIGGTFTDVVLVPDDGGEVRVIKTPTTPADPSEGFLNGLKEAFVRFDIKADRIAFAVHGTTIATNTIIEGKGASAGLITSEGFSDVLEIAYQTRPSLYDVFYEKPAPLIPRYRCLGVPERLAADGTVVVPLDEDAVERATRKLLEEGVEAIAIAFLHAYRDPRHERLAAQIIARCAPNLPVVLSSDVCPEYGEYPRTSTTVVNAVLQPKVAPYISRLEDRLFDLGLRTPLHLMTSSGGIISSMSAKELPVHLVESGPAAGVIGAAFVAQHVADAAMSERILALDIGGTTAKVSMIDQATPALADQFEVGSAARPTTTSSRGQGYPVKTSVISLVEIGAGGGSIAHIDPGGALTVGPESAGAVPGPACYGKGGDRPTMTDANLVLGRLDPDFFLGGAYPIDLANARAAIERDIARPLNLDIEEAAQAIVAIADAKMIAALEFISVQRGIDPRDYTLVPSGGNGALHAVAIAKALGIRRVIVPPNPGVNSALGLLATDIKHDYVKTIYRSPDKVKAFEFWGWLDEMAEAGNRMLDQHDIDVSRRELRFEAELCYVGQNYPLRVPVPAERNQTLSEIDRVFRSEHLRKYGFASDSEPTMIANVRLTAVGKVERPRLGARDSNDGLAVEPKGQRHVFFGRPVLTPVFDRDSLHVGGQVLGPAIIEQMDTTTVLPEGSVATVDPSGSLVITIHYES
jgi:N-methylhydantoinase A